MVFNIYFKLVPIAFIISHFLAARTHWQQSTKRIYFGQSVFEFNYQLLFFCLSFLTIFDIEDQQRRRQWDIEDEDRENAQSLAQSLTDPAEPTDLFHISTTAFLLLQRHAQGLPTTRATCVPDIMSAKYWTLAMKTFKAMGWKKGYKLSAPPDLNLSWPQFDTGTYIANDRFWVRCDGQDKEIA